MSEHVEFKGYALTGKLAPPSPQVQQRAAELTVPKTRSNGVT